MEQPNDKIMKIHLLQWLNYLAKYWSKCKRERLTRQEIKRIVIDNLSMLWWCSITHLIVVKRDSTRFESWFCDNSRQYVLTSCTCSDV